MDLTKYFKSDSSKKRDHSDDSNSGDDPKKIREERISSSSLAEMSNEVFTESLKSPDGIEILFNVLRNVEIQMKKNYIVGQETKDSQIKGEQHLEELTKSVKFLSSKIDEYEQERKENQKVINDLTSNVAQLSEQVKKLTLLNDQQEQYSRRNCLLVHGIEENKHEKTDDLVIETLKSNLEIDISTNDIDRTHRIGKPRGSGEKPRPIIVKLTRYNVRSKIYGSKKKLKGKSISITESLTATRLEKLKDAREVYGFNNVWTMDGKIFVKGESGDKPELYYK